MGTGETLTAPSLNEKHSALLRIWHWANFIVISCSLVTILISSTLLNPGTTGQGYQSALEKTGITINADQVKALNKSVSQNLWQWHKYFGYTLAALFLFRILLEFFQPGEEKFFGRIKRARNYLKLPAADTATSRHYFLVKLLYVAFYCVLFVILGTGLSMAFGNDLGIPKEIRGSIKEVHEFCMYVILSFIVIHLGGVVLGELGKFKGVVSGMINGKPE